MEGGHLAELHSIPRSVIGLPHLTDPMVAIVVAWQCERHIERCLGSILRASESLPCSVGVCVVEDASEDRTGEIAQSALREYPHSSIVKNETRSGSNLANTDYAVSEIVSNDDAICCAVDGDDWIEPNAFEVVRKAYLAQELDFAWTQFRMSDGRPGFCRPIPRGTNFRRYTWCSSHMKTWRRGAFQRIDKSRCFIGPDGKYFEMACDHALMFALSEVTDRYVFIDECVYIYNTENERSVFQDPQTKAREQQIAEYIRSL